jgi:flagellar L-ring protein precursor FlgH
MKRTTPNFRARALTLGAAATLLAALPTAADSLYTPGKSRSMFSDRKARAVGDVITVLITENTVAVQDAASEAKRKLDATADGGSDSWGIFKLIPRASLSGSVSHEGSGKTTRSSSLSSTISCRIAEITPGGQMVIKGERSQKVNADTETIKFSGIIRPEDIAPDNTIPSGAVADAQIELLGKGPIDRHVKPGLLSRIFQFLF